MTGCKDHTLSFSTCTLHNYVTRYTKVGDKLNYVKLRFLLDTLTSHNMIFKTIPHFYIFNSIAKFTHLFQK